MLRINTVKYIKKLIVQLLITLSLIITAFVVQANGIVVQTKQTQDELDLLWWMQGEKALTTTNAFIMANNNPIPHQLQVLAPEASLSACYLFLTDTSLSMKGYLKKQVIPLLESLTEKKSAQHFYAIGRFDSELEILSHYSKVQLESLKGVQKLQAKGKRTELFRTGLKGLEQLEQCSGYRRVLVLLSDGDAEDLQGAYNIEDVVTRANQQKISILTISFKDSINVQNLLKLSEGTGGWHQPYQSDNMENFIDHFEQVTDSGGRLTIKLSDLPEDVKTLSLQVILSDGEKKLIPIKTPDIPRPPLIAPEQQSKKVQKKIKEQQTTSSFPNWLQWLQGMFPEIPLNVWKIGLPILGVILVLLFLVSLKRSRTDPEQSESEVFDSNIITEKNTKVDPRPIARIESEEQRFFMTQNTISIGALSENDFVLNESTVGRHQATIDFKDNKFFIIDRGATNTCKVNGDRIQHCELQDGDQLQFGHWQGQFIFMLN